MASSNGNTTSINLSGGTVGSRNFRDYNASAISTAISRENYGTLLAANDPKMQKFREAVYKMVSTWTMEDKIAILTEYGDVAALPRNPSPEIINKALTESLIIHLDPKDLKILYDDVIVAEKKLIREVRTINNRTKLKRRFNTSSFEDTFKNYAQKKKTAVKAARASGEMDDSYKVPRWAQKVLGKLQRELKDVLSGSMPIFNKVELTGVAMRMGIEIPEGTPFKQVVQWIINKTALYVALILGCGKANYANAFMDSAPYEDVLQYTSYSYVTGKPGMDKGEWRAKVTAARRAKAAIRERARMQNRHLSARNSGFGRTWGSAARAIARNDTGVLAEASYEQLLELAGKYGINPARMNTNRLKARLYAAMATETREISRLNARRQRQVDRGHGTRDIDDRIAAHTGYSDKDILGLNNKVGLGSQSNVPVIKLNSNGSVDEDLINLAVPVYLVGQGGAGITKQGATKIKGGELTLRKGVVGIGKGVSLKKEDEDLITYFRNLPDKNPNDVRRRGRNGLPRSVDALQDIVQNCPFSNKETLMIIRNDIAAGRVEARWAWAYAWCMCNRRTAVANAIRERYGVYYPGVFRRNRYGAAVFGRVMAGIWSLGVTELVRGIAGGARHLRTRAQAFRNPTNFNDLPDKSKNLYNQLDQMSIQKLKEACQDAYSATALQAVVNKYGYAGNEDQYKSVLMALFAHAQRDEVLVRYLIFVAREHKYDYSGDDEYKDCRKALRFGQRVAGIGRVIANLFKGRRSEGAVASETEEDGTGGYDPLNNPGQRLPIPKIAWNMKDGYKVSDILEVVPVYIVNQYARTFDEMFEHGSMNIMGSGNQIIGVQHFENAKIGSENTITSAGGEGGGNGGSMNNSSNIAKGINFGNSGNSSTNTDNSNKVGISGSLFKKPNKSSDGSGDSDDDSNLITEKKLINVKVRDDFSGIMKGAIIPVFAVNSIFNDRNFSNKFNGVVKAIGSASQAQLEMMSQIETSLGSFTLGAPMGVGVMTNPVALAFAGKDMASVVAGAVADLAAIAAEEALTANTGGRITKMASGGNRVITGDAPGNNIFKGGAKPELVSSDGDINVTPLNKTGTESRSKITRMSSEDRRQALATAISSHAVKFSYKLPDGVSEITNEGEAIKVFSVKPGLTDTIDIAGQQTSVAELLGGIYTLLGQITQSSATGTELLAAIAAKPVAAAPASNGDGGNPFAGGFPDNLANILEGA